MTDEEKGQVLDLLVYTRCFATLLGAGVSLQNILTILEEISDEPLASATVQMLKGILEQDRTLSAAMRERPDLFTRAYVQMAWMGEIGGVLDEAFTHVADLIESDWAIWKPGHVRFRSLLVPPDEGVSFDDSTPDEKLRLLSLYCRSLGMLRVAGVPFADLTQGCVNALSAAAEILPPGPERHALATIPERLGKVDALRSRLLELPFIPRFVPRLVGVGEESGTLDQMLEKAAQLLEYQRRHYLLKRGE